MGTKEAEWESYKVRAVNQLKAQMAENCRLVERVGKAEEEERKVRGQLSEANEVS